ncbi:protein RER1-like [Paramacrobiotus metropolitanus]|uniref:protein RER1-like n=1 Tax=Paramacrobiotus metropolitanus TaxID=2943436 RepID=UPI0024460ECC|nr:protein RER1-like [Paramacrobiotus metropolitanus]
MSALQRIGQIYQSLLDKSVPYLIARWVTFGTLILAFIARIFLAQGWYIVTYGLFIYHLNLFLAFLTPKIDPAFADDNDDGLELPTRSTEEFRPFIRRLPEFKFWLAATKATVIALIMTFFEIFNIPVFWPILVVYFILLFCLTMKRQIKHMIKYRYLPFTFGKPKYAGREGHVGNVQSQ